jgi:hypothetical protein
VNSYTFVNSQSQGEIWEMETGRGSETPDPAPGSMSLWGRPRTLIQPSRMLSASSLSMSIT